MLYLEFGQILDQLLLGPVRVLRLRRSQAAPFRIEDLQFLSVAEVRVESLFVVLLKLNAQFRVFVQLGQRGLGTSLEEAEVDLILAMVLALVLVGRENRI